MALDFPSPATPGQVYTAAGKSWVYDASFGWLSTSSANPAAQYIAKFVCVGGETTIDFQNIPQNFTDLELVWASRDTAAGTSTQGLRLKVNNDATSGNYASTARSGSASGSWVGNLVTPTVQGAALAFHMQDGNTVGLFGGGSAIFPNYTSSVAFKRFVSNFGQTDAGNGECVFTYTGRWLATTPVNRLTIGTDGTAFKAGSTFTLYGRGAVATSPAVYESSTAPGNPYAGMLWWKSDEGTLKIYYNGAWIDAATPGGAGSGMTRLAKIVCTGGETSVNFPNIPQGYTDLKLTWQARETASGTADNLLGLKINNDATIGNYDPAIAMNTAGSGVSGSNPVPTSAGVTLGFVPNDGATVGATGGGEFTLFNYASNVFFKQGITKNFERYGTAPSYFTDLRSFTYRLTNPVTALTVTTGGIGLKAGSTFTLYGLGAASGTAAAGVGGDPSVCQGRLTLTSLTPVTTADVLGATTIYFTPYKGCNIGLFFGGVWSVLPFVELAIALGTLVAAKNYDLFAYNNNGAVAIDAPLAWGTDTARATGLALQDGILVKSGDASRRYLGSFRTTSTTTTEDSAGGVTTQVGGKRFLWNYYNRVQRTLAVIDTTVSYTYTTGTVRQVNGAAGNKVEYVVGMAEDPVEAYAPMIGISIGMSTVSYVVGVGIDSVTVLSGAPGVIYNSGSSSSDIKQTEGRYKGVPGLGYHYAAWVERGAGSSGTFYMGNVTGFGTNVFQATVLA